MPPTARCRRLVKPAPPSCPRPRWGEGGRQWNHAKSLPGLTHAKPGINTLPKPATMRCANQAPQAHARPCAAPTKPHKHTLGADQVRATRRCGRQGLAHTRCPAKRKQPSASPAAGNRTLRQRSDKSTATPETWQQCYGLRTAPPKYKQTPRPPLNPSLIPLPALARRHNAPSAPALKAMAAKRNWEQRQACRRPTLQTRLRTHTSRLAPHSPTRPTLIAQPCYHTSALGEHSHCSKTESQCRDSR